MSSKTITHIHLLKELLVGIEQPKPRTRMTNYDAAEQLRLYALAGLDLSVRAGLVDWVFWTVNLREQDTPDSVMRDMGESLHAVAPDDPWLWFGVHVPAVTCRSGPQQRHCHLITPLRRDDNERIMALIGFQKMRNEGRLGKGGTPRRIRARPRAFCGKYAYNLTGLLRYLSGRENLRATDKAGPCACRAVKNRAGSIALVGPAALDEVRDALQKATGFPVRSVR